MAEKKTKRQKKQPGNGKGGQSALRIVGRVLPLLSVAIAFVAVVLLYRKLMPPPVAQANEEPQVSAEQEAQVAASSSHPEAYNGVEDKWVPEGVFTTGNRELDQQVKQFCDALTVEGASVRENAHTAYNTIVWSNYEDRSADEAPTGNDWAINAAQHFFSTGDPEKGISGTGDVYEFAAAVGFCMRYFGFYDAITVPVIGSVSSGSSSGGGALVLVSDEYGQPCVCDPQLTGDGWMLDRELYDIVVDDIGQDLTRVEDMGLTVHKNSNSMQETSTSSR